MWRISSMATSDHLRTELGRNEGRLLPGFPEILEALARLPNVAVGLLTGNLRRGAELKLGHYGMLDLFAVRRVRG